MTANNPFDIMDRVIVLTGGLGNLGQEFTRALLQQGARVAVLDRDCQRQLAAGRLADVAEHERLLVIETDVTDRRSLEQALEQITARWSVPFGLINNAALDSPPDAPASENGPFEDYPLESWEKVMRVNATGVFLCCQVFGGAMAREGRGAIVNIASIYGLVSPDQGLYEYRRRNGEVFFKPVAYAASKSSLYNLTRYLATYWGPRNVRVNAVTFAGVFGNQPQDFLAAYEAKVPLGRMAQPDEYNGTILYLMSDASAYMTGSNVVIDGGFTAW